MELFIYLFAALFSVLNPIGTVPIFVGLTMDDDAKERFLCGLLLTYSLF
jgi:multiple antibiotic resistance protein